MGLAGRRSRAAWGIRALRARAGEEQGFTLIEIMIVLIVIGVLLAIAVPTFLGTKSGAQDISAKQTLSEGILAAKGLYVIDGGDFSAITGGNANAASQTAATLMKGQAGGITWVRYGPGSTAPSIVGVYVPSADPEYMVLSAMSDTNSCFYAMFVSTAPAAGTDDQGVTVPGVWYAKVPNSTRCGPLAVMPVTAADWSSSWPAT